MTRLEQTEQSCIVYQPAQRVSKGSFIGVLVLLSLGAAFSADAAARYEPEGLLAVSDFKPPGKIRIVDPARDTIVYDYFLSQDPSEPCNGEQAHCFPTGFRHLTIQGSDYLDFMMTVTQPGAESPADLYYAVVQRVKVSSPPQVVWKIKNLDFSDVPDGDVYCKSSGDPTAPQDPMCRIAFGEGMRVIDDRPSEHLVTVIVADGDHGRVMQLTLDYSSGSTCAHVDWVLGETHPDWPVLGRGGLKMPGWPNSVDYINEGSDGPYLLIGFFVSELMPIEPPTSGSRMTMWHYNGIDWELSWQFPDVSLGVESCLNTPHMAELLTDPLTGKRTYWYSHSRGAADTWMAQSAGYGATFGILEPGETLSSPPVYLMDAGFFEDTAGFELKFTRDQDYLPDGTMLLTDAGCQNMCTNAAVVYRVEPWFLPASPVGKEGYYSPDHAHQEMLEIGTDAIIDTVACDFGALFEADWISSAQMGSELRAAAQNARRKCP